MRQRLKHIKSTTKILADGTRRTHRYHRLTGKRIEGMPGTPEFVASYLSACKFDGRAQPGTIAALVTDYKSDDAFKHLAQRTRTDYAKILDTVCDKFGNAPIGAFEDKRMRRDIRNWRDVLAERSPRQADYHVSVLSALLGYAITEGILEVNAAANVKRLYRGDRSDKVWTAGDIETFEAVANLPLRLGLHLAHDLGQREGDLIKLQLSQYDGERIQLRQSKGKRRVDVKVTQRCRDLIALELERRAALPGNVQATTLMAGMRGRPWTEGGFRCEWQKAAKRANIHGRLTYHDLRGTCVTRLYELEGIDTANIVSITGHTLKAAEDIIDRYLARTRKLGDQAIDALERERLKG